MNLQPNEVLVLAADDAAREVGKALCNRRDTTWPLLIVNHPGEALRCVVKSRPKLLVVCATLERLEATARLIEALRRGRPHNGGALPLVAMAASHDEAIERAARIAGATHYLTLNSRTDEGLLDQLLKLVGVPPPDTVVPASARPPPQLALPPPRSRRPSDRSRTAFRT